MASLYHKIEMALLLLPIRAAVVFRKCAPQRLQGSRLELAVRTIYRRLTQRLFLPNSTAASKSMLHGRTIARLASAASRCDGAILEIGAFVGGATIVMAQVARPGSLVVAIEVGGTFDHSAMGSADILDDLYANLRQHGMASRVTVVEGWSNVVVDEVTRVLNSQKVGLFVVDADGDVERDFTLYRDLLAPGAQIVIDDYIAPGNVKQPRVQSWVQTMVAEGVLEECGVELWGTWFGRYRGGGAVA